MRVPPDGSLRIITSSNLDALSNVVIVKIPDDIKKPYEHSYQLASLDPSKDDSAWPANAYIRKLIPDFYKQSESVEEEYEKMNVESKCEVNHGGEGFENEASSNKQSQVTQNRFYKQKKFNNMQRQDRNKHKFSRSVSGNQTHKTVDINPWLREPVVPSYQIEIPLANSFGEQWNPSQYTEIELNSFGNNNVSSPYSNQLYNFPVQYPYKQPLLGEYPNSNASFQNNCSPFNQMNITHKYWNDGHNASPMYPQNFNANRNSNSIGGANASRNKKHWNKNFRRNNRSGNPNARHWNPKMGRNELGRPWKQNIPRDLSRNDNRKAGRKQKFERSWKQNSTKNLPTDDMNNKNN